MKFTGRQIVLIRGALEFSTKEFSSLLGVNIATVYRWELQSNKYLNIDSIQNEILTSMRKKFRKLKKKEKIELGKRLRNKLKTSNLHSLLELLKNIL